MNLIKKIPGKLQAEMSKIVKKFHEAVLRRRLKNDNFSIICSNCVGGIIYNRLGRAFLSPTINLWMHQHEFLKLVFDLKSYMNEDLVFIDTKYDHPVAQLKDVKIYFNHYKTEEEAKSCWDRRKQRINYDNLYIMMYDRDDITREDLMRLKNLPCRNVVVFSDKYYEDIPYVVRMQESGGPNGKQFLDADKLGIKTFEKQFDYVHWLNSELSR